MTTPEAKKTRILAAAGAVVGLAALVLVGAVAVRSRRRRDVGFTETVPSEESLP